MQLVAGSVLLLSCSDRTLNIDSVNIPLQSTDTAMTTFNDYLIFPCACRWKTPMNAILVLREG